MSLHRPRAQSTAGQGSTPLTSPVMAATSVTTGLQHRPQLEPVDLSRTKTNTEDIQSFLQRVKEGRSELTIQKVESRQAEEERQRLEILSSWSKTKKVHKCNYKGCDKVANINSQHILNNSRNIIERPLFIRE